MEFFSFLNKIYSFHQPILLSFPEFMEIVLFDKEIIMGNKCPLAALRMVRVAMYLCYMLGRPDNRDLDWLPDAKEPICERIKEFSVCSSNHGKIDICWAGRKACLLHDLIICLPGNAPPF